MAQAVWYPSSVSNSLHEARRSRGTRIFANKGAHGCCWSSPIFAAVLELLWTHDAVPGISQPDFQKRNASDLGDFWWNSFGSLGWQFANFSRGNNLESMLHPVYNHSTNFLLHHSIIWAFFMASSEFDESSAFVLDFWCSGDIYSCQIDLNHRTVRGLEIGSCRGLSECPLGNFPSAHVLDCWNPITIWFGLRTENTRPPLFGLWRCAASCEITWQNFQR